MGSNAEVRAAIESDLKDLLESHFEINELVRQPISSDLNKTLGDPFHYIAEFPEVSDEQNGRRTIDFDVVIGNPPYGDILNSSEKALTGYYDTTKINDIVAQFVEREIELLADDGYFGNITTLSVMQSSMEVLHEEIQDKLANAQAACFGLRGRTGIFEGVLVRVSIITGQKDAAEADGIDTSDLLVFTDETRQKCIENIEYGSTDGLVLRDQIGGDGSGGPILPKVGPEIKRSILEILKQRDGRQFRDVYEKLADSRDGNHPLFRSASGGYWITAMFEERYSSSKIDQMEFENEIERKMGFILFHSSLYYVYFATYSNQRDHLWTITDGFPFPDAETISENSEQIDDLAGRIWDAMDTHSTCTGPNRVRFTMSPLRPLIDELDEFIGQLYDLSDEEIEYTQSYLADFHDYSCRTGLEDTTLDAIDADTYTQRQRY